GRDRSQRSQDRRLPLDRARRPEREHDGLRRPHHAHAHRSRRRDAGREEPTPEPPEGPARPARKTLRARAREAARGARRHAPLSDRVRRAGREDSYLQLSREPRHRSPHQADGAPARPGAPGRVGRVHRGAGRRGTPPGARRVKAADALNLAEERLAEAGVDTPRADAEFLVAHVLAPAVDAAPGAVALARENAERLELDVEIREGDLDVAAEGWDLVVSNPPYVSPDEWDSLQPEIREWEPRDALVGEGLHEEIARLAST